MIFPIVGYECHVYGLFGIENYVAGNKTFPSGVVWVVVEEGVCLGPRHGDLARAPRYVIPGRGLHQIYGQWGSSVPATGTPLGAAFLVPCQPRYRMGFRGPARKHARYQRQRDVYRGDRSAVDWRGLYRALRPRTAFEARLLCETDRTRTRHGRICGSLRIRQPEALPELAFRTLKHRPLMPSYTNHDDTVP